MLKGKYVIQHKKLVEKNELKIWRLEIKCIILHQRNINYIKHLISKTMKVYNIREAIRVIKDNGFELARTKGDHQYYKHKDGRQFAITSTRLNRMMWQRLVKENKLVCAF